MYLETIERLNSLKYHEFSTWYGESGISIYEMSKL